jgi:protein-tyrosine phosphatase
MQATDYPENIRFYDVPGGLNFRDVGGYATVDGRRVRYGQLFRSGLMSGFEDGAVGEIAALGVRSVCDLRAREERDQHPSHWLTGREIHQSVREDSDGSGDLLEFYRSVEAEPGSAREIMLRGYRTMPYTLAPSYRALFQRLLAGETPLIFHCAAGKDRTGIAAALVLTALGVPRDMVLRDYRTTDRLYDQLFAVMRAQVDGILDLERNGEIWDPLLVCDPDYLAATFEEMDRRDGGVEAYLRTHAGVGEREIEQLRDTLTEPHDQRLS